jgi:hypothetical protein
MIFNMNENDAMPGDLELITTGQAVVGLLFAPLGITLDIARVIRDELKVTYWDATKQPWKAVHDGDSSRTEYVKEPKQNKVGFSPRYL